MVRLKWPGWSVRHFHTRNRLTTWYLAPGTPHSCLGVRSEPDVPSKYRYLHMVSLRQQSTNCSGVPPCKDLQDVKRAGIYIPHHLFPNTFRIHSNYYGACCFNGHFYRVYWGKYLSIRNLKQAENFTWPLELDYCWGRKRRLRISLRTPAASETHLPAEPGAQTHQRRSISAKVLQSQTIMCRETFTLPPNL